MSPVRVVVSVLLMVSAVGCGGSARVDGGASGQGAGASDGGNGPGAGGSPSAGSPSAGSPSAGSPSGGGAGGDGSCIQGDVRYKNHESWKCDCNTCYCTDGQFSSTLAACYTCQQGSTSYLAGDTFPSTDGCNTCTCEASGQIACTEKACVCNPSTEWSKKYLSTDPKTCAAADFACPTNTKLFGNDCGCGCQQDPYCPEWIDCMPGPQTTSCADQMAKCPYSKVAL